MLFIYNLCQELDMDKKDIIALFQEIRLYYGKRICTKSELLCDAERIFENYSLSKLDIKRMYRYLDKNVKKDAEEVLDDDIDDDF
jgi:hypothetical protein